MSDNAGNDSNNDGNVDMGEKVIGGDKMTDAERDAFDRELNDFLGGEDTSTPGRSGPGDMGGANRSYNDGTSSSSDDNSPSPANNFGGSQRNYNSSWNTGDEVPSVPVLDGNTGKTYVNGEEVTRAEYDQAVIDRSNFVDLASDPTKSKAAEDAFVAETMRSRGVNPNNKNDDNYEEAYNSALMDVANYDSITSRNEAAAQGLTKGGPKSSMQIDLEMIMSGAVDAPPDQVKAAARQYGQMLAQGSFTNVAGENNFLQDNMNNVQMYGGNINKIELGKEIADGFNSTTTMGSQQYGFNKDTPVIGGIGGNRMDIDRNGNVRLRSGEGYLGENLTEGLKFAAQTKLGPVGSTILGGVGVDTSVPFSSYDNFMGGTIANNPKVTFDPNRVAGGMLGNMLGPKVAQEVYNQSGGNMALTKLGVMGANQGINMGIDQLMPGGPQTIGELNLGGGSAGQGTAKAGTATNTVQSDLGNSLSDKSAFGGSSTGYDRTDSNNFNIKDGQSSSKPNNSNMNFGTGSGGDSGGNNNSGSTTNSAAITNMGGDVNTLLEQNDLLLNPLGEGQQMPEGVSMLNPMNTGFGGYLTKGKNRNYGNATFRTATRNEVNRNKRRSGLGSGILFG